MYWSFLDVTSSKEPACQCWRCKRCRFDLRVGEIPCRRAWQPTPLFLPGESHGQRKLMGYSPQGRKEPDTDEVTQHARLHTDIYYPVTIFFQVCFCRSFPYLVFPAQRSSFNICCRAGLVVLNSLNFCLSVKLLISLSNLNDILARQSNLGSRFFCFITLNISCLSLLACRVSAEKSTDNLMRSPL